MKSIRNRGFSDHDLRERCRTHSAGDLEAQLADDGPVSELRDVLASVGVRGADHLRGHALAAKLRDNKTAYAAELAARIRVDPDTARRMPAAFREAIEKLRGLQ